MDAPRKKRSWVVVALIFALPFASCGAFGVYGIGKVRWARATVGAYCDAVVVGAPIAGLDARARDMSLQVMSIAPNTPGAPHKEGKILVWEGFAFARHFCEIDHDGSVVTGKHTSALD